MDLLFLSLFFITITLVVYFVFSTKTCYKLPLLIVSFLFMALVFYIRVGFGRYFTTIDESYYVSLLGNTEWYRTSIVSGYLTPFFLHVLRPFFSTPVSEILGYSIAMSVIYTLFLFVIYLVIGLSSKRAVISTIVVLMTPLYLWSVIQVRPQQVGLLVGLFIVALFVRMKPGWKLFVISVLLYTLLIFSHVLSYLIYSSLLLLYLSISIVKDGEDYKRKYWILAGSIIISWVAFVIFPYSVPILKNMTWLLNSIAHTKLSYGAFSMAFLVVMVMVIVGLYLALNVLREHLNRAWSSMFLSAERYLIRLYDMVSRRFFALLVFLVILVVVYIQFKLGMSVYTHVYGGSMLAILFFQMGNLVFALLYVWGVLQGIKEGHFGNFEILSLLMLFTAGTFLVLSFFMPRGNGIWGFHNWFIRGLQYFIPLSAPIVSFPLLADFDFGETTKKFAVSVLIALLIIISTLNTARVPGIYDYTAVWSHELLGLCGEVNGVYIPRIELSPYAYFVDNNLLETCGSTLSKDPGNSLFVAASDGFYVQPSQYSSLTIGYFGRLVSMANNILVISSGSISRNSYVFSMFRDATFVHVTPRGSCSLSDLITNRPVLIIGGPASNPCTIRLEKLGTLGIKVGSNYVVTFTSTYRVPSPDKWWESKEGLFVILSLSYHGVPIMVVEGTNLDATLAGVYYLTNEIYPNIVDYDSTHYLVGKWSDTDGIVISAAKETPEDTHGFSPRDKITILEKG